MPTATVTVAEPALWDPDVTYVLGVVTEGPSHGLPGWTLLFDRDGNVVWAHRSPVARNTMYSRPAVTGDAILVDHSSYFSSLDDGASSEIVALTLDGNVVQAWSAPGQHHPFTQLPDGSVVYTSYRQLDSQPRPDDDVIVQIHPDGQTEDLFSCVAWAKTVGEERWCGTNTITYDEQRRIYLLSIFTYETVIEIDAATLEARRWFGQAPGSYAFDPPSSRFDYQHGPVYTDTGTLLLSTHSDTVPGNEELAVREYRVDTEGERLEEVWSWGVGLGVTGRGMGEAHRLPGGNTLHNYGTYARLREVTPDGVLVWDIEWEPAEEGPGEGHHKVGRTTPLTTSLYDFAP